MTIKNWKLSRRAVLRGVAGSLGVALGLPALEAMLNTHGEALADGQPLPKRFMTWFFGNGVRLEHWVPSAQGAGYDLKAELEPLAAVQDYCSVLTGFNNKAGYGRRGHHDGVAGCFSGHPFIELPADGANYSSKFGGASIDQLVAGHIGSQTYLPSLEVGVSKRVTKGEGPTLQFISHKGPDQPVAPEYNPQAVYTKLFASYTPEDDPSGGLRVSMLDAVLEDAKRLQKRVGSADRARLEAHMESVLQLEKQILALPPSCTMPTMPDSTNADVDGKEPLVEVSHAMADLVALAFACDVTRVSSFLQNGSVGGTVYHMTGTSSDLHYLSHEIDGQELVHQAVIVNMQCFAYLLERMMGTQDGAGNLLDSTTILLGSDCAEGISHSSVDQPIIVAGRGGGALQYPGVHYRSPNGENTSDILLSAVQSVVPEITEIGTQQGYSNTPCAALKA